MINGVNFNKYGAFLEQCGNELNLKYKIET